MNQEGQIYLNLEDVAKGIGFIKVDKKNGKEYTRVDKNRVISTLETFGINFPKIKGEYVDESTFYLLAMRGNSKTAREFQIKIATTILPQIRKYGMYVDENVTDKEIEEYKLYGNRRVKRGFVASTDKRDYMIKCLEYHKKDTVEYIKAIKIMLKEIKNIDLTSLRGSEMMQLSELTIDLLKLKNERENRSKGVMLGYKKSEIKKLTGRDRSLTRVEAGKIRVN